MNYELMKAIGVNIREKPQGRRDGSKYEITIYKGIKKERQYCISIRPDIARRLGDYIFVSEPWQDRLLFFPASKNDKDARAISHKGATKGTRGIVAITAKQDENLDQFLGRYDLKWWPEMEGYYISTSSPFRSVKEATA